MEPASVTEQGVPAQKAAQSLVTADDLKREIGEWVVANINNTKMLKRAVEQINVLTARVQQQEIAVQERDALKKSNELFSGKNGKLADDLRDVRAELVKANGENVAIGKAVEAKDKAHEKVASKVESLTDDIKNARDDLRIAQEEHAVAIGDRDLEIKKLTAKHDRLLKTRAKKA